MVVRNLFRVALVMAIAALSTAETKFCLSGNGSRLEIRGNVYDYAQAAAPNTALHPSHGLSQLKTFNSRKYYMGSNGSSWDAAKEFCAKLNMRMTSLDTVGEQEMLKGVLVPSGWYWLSGSDESRTPGLYYWDTGARVNNVRWQDGYPKYYKYTPKTCIGMTGGAGFVWDYNCDNLAAVFCEQS